MVKQHYHFGFEDPSRAIGKDEYLLSEFRRVRDEIKDRFFTFYKDHIK